METHSNSDNSLQNTNNTVKQLTFKLQSHQKDYSKDEMIICQKSGEPKLEIGDVIEIYQTEDKFSRLLMQVKSFEDPVEASSKYNENRISLEQSIVSTFQLKNFTSVNVNVVQPIDIMLDSIELVFKDQYIARSDMWRIKRHISETSVYLNKKIDFLNVRCQVYEMWSQGERMACGYVTKDTKVVFRSSSSMVYLFIQMSCEMWDYDINGDLYFEKAVNGLLSDLFDKWKRFNCSHDVTIVLFSRTFYDAYSSDQFPEKMREVLQTDYKGRFYEDYYRVAVQNDRHEDWTPILGLLRKLFNQYEDEVIKYHEKHGLNIPRAYNSTASQGNFLEVLNISLNVFEKHHLYRSFDRTGQLSVVISPGVGVFEVDLDLTNVTKQRIIDNGIGSDLVCLGEQPLHAVPLFKFNAKKPNTTDVQYNMPHWINLSFYSSSKPMVYSNFVPRIKLPNFLSKSNNSRNSPNNHSRLYRSPSRDSTSNLSKCQSIPTLIDYDEYDDQIFKVPSSTSPPTNSSSANTCQPSMRIKSLIDKTHLEVEKIINEVDCSEDMKSSNIKSSRSLKSEGIGISRSRNHLSPLLGGVPLMSTSVENKSFKDFRPKPESKDDLIVHGFNNYSRNDLAKSKALINPFDPSHVTIKLTSNRRRWTHVFPLGPTGIFMQQHHYQAVPQNTACTLLPSAVCADASLTSNLVDDRDSPESQSRRKISIAQLKSNELSWLQNTERKPSYKSNNTNNTVNVSVGENSKSNKRLSSSLANNESTKNTSISSSYGLSDKSLLWAWGATGEQEWTPAITTGVDWKSMVMPACLPITTDFLPDKRTLRQDYLTYEYNLLGDDENCNSILHHCYRGEEDSKNHVPLSTFQVYLELICQRLQQGFQIIVLPNSEVGDNVSENMEQCKYAMSIGRIFHEIKLSDRAIDVITYHPRHPYHVSNIDYCYRFRAPDNEKYGVSWVHFGCEKLEVYKWNYLDISLCSRGIEFPLCVYNFKCWKFRVLLLPAMQPITKAIIDKSQAGQQGFPCDNYRRFTNDDIVQLQEGFIKFLEVINKLRRPMFKNKTNTKPETRKSTSSLRINRRFSVAVSQSTPLNAQTTRLSQPTEMIRNDINDSAILRESNESNLTNNNNISIKPNLFKTNSKDKPSNCDEIDGNFVSSNKQIPLSDLESHQNDDIFEDHDTSKRLTIDSSHSDIIDALKDENSLNFLPKNSGLPQWTFISAEAVIWAKNNIEHVYTDSLAIELFQSLQKEGLICHASGKKDHPFIHGFCLYYIIDSKNPNNYDSSRFRSNNNNDLLTLFAREWMEAEIVPQNFISKRIEDYYSAANSELISGIIPKKRKDFTFTKSRLDLEDGSKYDRVEWVDLIYHTVYDPEQSFEILIEWMVATGNSISEIVIGWNRKIGSTGLHLVPIPYDPFALPYSSQSDPLRGPIYISLNTECLTYFTPMTQISKTKLLSFQEMILVKFGFIPFHDLTNVGTCQFVHVSGSIFVMILGKSSHDMSNRKRGKLILERGGIVNLHNDVDDTSELKKLTSYITRHFTGVKQSEDTRIENKIGFIWCWNYMITKRWKNALTGDENSMRKIYQDFRLFCSNKDDRLKSFFDENYDLISNINELNSDIGLNSEQR